MTENDKEKKEIKTSVKNYKEIINSAGLSDLSGYNSNLFNDPFIVIVVCITIASVVMPFLFGLGNSKIFSRNSWDTLIDNLLVISTGLLSFLGVYKMMKEMKNKEDINIKDETDKYLINIAEKEEVLLEQAIKEIRKEHKKRLKNMGVKSK